MYMFILTVRKEIKYFRSCISNIFLGTLRRNYLKFSDGNFLMKKPHLYPQNRKLIIQSKRSKLFPFSVMVLLS